MPDSIGIAKLDSCMQSHASIAQPSLEDLVNQILFSRTITRAEEDFLFSALCSQSMLDEEQKAAIQRVFYGLRHGLLKIVD